MFLRKYEEVRRDLDSQPSSYWEKRGSKNALTLFHLAAEYVPAYADFLKKNKVKHTSISDIKTFSEAVPFTSKKEYIQQYSPDELAWPTSLVGGSVIYSSSGTSGAPTFWRRNARHDAEAGLLHEIVLKNSFAIERRSTLFIDCFALGIHVAGYITATAINSIMDRCPNISLATPGSKKEDIITLLLQQSESFDQIVLMGYPPLMRDVVAEATEKGFDWSKKKAGFLFAAQGFSEAWRENLQKMVGSTTAPIINIYGSADSGPLGFETPTTIALRRAAAKDPKDTSFTLPSVQNTCPYIYQYFPELRYFEQVNNELVFTGDNGVPLIRYNIHDIGGIKSFDDQIIVRSAKATIRLPFVYLYGRSNYSVVFYGANIYPDTIQTALEQESLMPFATGKFYLEVVEDKQLKPQLEIHIEMEKVVSDAESKKFTSIILEKLLSLNREFVVVYKEMGNEDKVSIIFHKKNDQAFAQRAPKKFIEKKYETIRKKL